MEIWALIAGAFSVALGYGVVAPALPQLAHSFNVSFTAASGIVSAFALMRLLFAPAAGWIVQRLGERLTYMTGILIVAASTGACAIAATFGQLLILRGLGGVGSVMFSVATSGLLIRLAPVSERGRVSSLNAAGFLLGNLLGPVMGGVVAGFGLRAPFVLYFFTLIIACAIVGLSLRNSSIGGRPNPNRERTELIRLPEALQFSQYRAALITFSPRVGPPLVCGLQPCRSLLERSLTIPVQRHGCSPATPQETRFLFFRRGDGTTGSAVNLSWW